MEWWQILGALAAGIGMLAGAAYGVMVAVVREKERIYQRRKRAEEERAQLALMPLAIDEGAAKTGLPGILARQGVKVLANNLASATLKLGVAMREVSSTHLPTQSEVSEAWFEWWYCKEGRFQILLCASGIAIRPGYAGHRTEAMAHCPKASTEQWEAIVRRKTRTTTSRVFEVVLEAEGKLLLQKCYVGAEELSAAALEIKDLILALELEPEPVLDEAQWERSKERMAAEESGEVVKVKRG